jgi:hypothetical protein
MSFKFDSSSKSQSDSQGILDFLERIHKVDSIDKLEAIIKKAAEHKAKSVLIKEKGELSLKVGDASVAGIPINISLVPKKENVYKVEFI